MIGFDTHFSYHRDNNEITRVEVEVSVGWMRTNPALAVSAICEFANNYEAGLTKASMDCSRKGFITFIAERAD